MSDIILSAATRNSIVALQQLNAELETVQLRMATGKKVNTPTDDPAAFFTAASLSTQASALNTLLDGIGNAASAISTATTAIASIQSLLDQAQTVANDALASTASSLVTVTGTRSGLTTATKIATSGGDGTHFKAGDTVTVSDGTTTATYTAVNNDSVQTFLDAINNTAGLKVTASLSGGQIVLSADDAVNVTIGGTIAGAGGATLSSIVGLTAGTTSFTANTTRSAYATQFNSILSQIDALASDASYNGINLLTGGSTTATFNATGSSTYTVNGVSATSSGLGLSTAAGSFQTDTDVNSALTQVTSAIASLEAAATSFSTASTIISTRQDFTNSLVGFLNSAADSLTATDPNADGAELLALQTRQQIAATALTITATSDNTLLKLFGASGSTSTVG